MRKKGENFNFGFNVLVDSFESASDLRDTLKSKDYIVEGLLNYTGNNQHIERSEKRRIKILDYLLSCEKLITELRLYSKFRSRTFHYKSMQRDLCILIVEGKIKLVDCDYRGVKTKGFIVSDKNEKK